MKRKKPTEKQTFLHPPPRLYSMFCWKKSLQNSKFNSFFHFMLPGFSVSITKPLSLSGVCSALSKLPGQAIFQPL